MTDVTVSPPEAPINEVPIDTNQTSSPTPIGSQAPERSPQEARRDAIQEAFNRADKGKDAKPAQRPAPKAAEAKPGHNQPPEETPKEKIDLRKPPAKDDRPRADHGHFAPRDQGAGNGQARSGLVNAGQPGQPGQQQQPVYKRLPPQAPFAEPPQRIAEHARRDWADTPETVRGEIHRMHHEFGQAYQQYRGAAEAFMPVAKFHEMARRQGTTLEAALNNFVSIEAKLRDDPIAGLDQIVNNLGLTDPDTGRRINLRDVSYHVLSQSPEQLQVVQQGNAQSAAKNQIGALYQEVTGLKNALDQMHNQQQYERRYIYTSSAVDQFANSHPRFDELTDLIHNEITLGFDLDTAYRRAELLRPGTHAAQTRNAPPSAQTRTADKSISGSPGGVAPSNGASRRPDKQVGRREAIENAINMAGGLH